jgi:hypothetical protein
MRTARTRRTGLMLVAAGFVLAACNPIRVSTMMAPDANLGSLRTFKMMNVPPRRTVVVRPLENDPMFENSISNRAIQVQLTAAFSARGYVMNDANPDFTVAYYASRRGRLDVSAWDYGYPGRWGGWRGGPGIMEVTPFVEGTVIVDVVNPKTHELVWRGRGVSTVSDDPETYANDLNRTVREIVKRFPGR